MILSNIIKFYNMPFLDGDNSIVFFWNDDHNGPAVKVVLNEKNQQFYLADVSFKTTLTAGPFWSSFHHLTFRCHSSHQTSMVLCLCQPKTLKSIFFNDVWYAIVSSSMMFDKCLEVILYMKYILLTHEIVCCWLRS